MEVDLWLVCPQEQRLVEDSTREVKKVRKARNRRLEWNMMAYDKEFRPDNRFSPSPYHMASSEGSLSPDNRQVLPITPSARWVSFAFRHFWLSSSLSLGERTSACPLSMGEGTARSRKGLGARRG